MSSTAVSEFVSSKSQELVDKIKTFGKIKAEKLAEVEEFVSQMTKDFELLLKQKKTKSKKSQENPTKRPTTAFILFSKHQRINGPKTLTELGLLWKSASDEEKQPFIDMNLKEREEYQLSVNGGVSKIKKPTTAFFFFLKENREHVKQSNPDMTAIELTKELGKQWKTLSVSEKEVYNQKYLEDKERYSKESSEEQSEEKKVEMPKKKEVIVEESKEELLEEMKEEIVEKPKKKKLAAKK